MFTVHFGKFSSGLVGGAGLVMFTCTARGRVIFLDICMQEELVLPWKNGIRQGKFSLKPLFYITQEQQSQ